MGCDICPHAENSKFEPAPVLGVVKIFMCVSSDWRCNAQCENLSSEANISEDEVVHFSLGTTPSICKSSYASEKELLFQMARELGNSGEGSIGTWKSDSGGSSTKFGPRASASGVLQPGWQEMQQHGMKLKLCQSGSFLHLGSRPRHSAKTSLRAEGVPPQPEVSDPGMSTTRSMRIRRSSSQHRSSSGAPNRAPHLIGTNEELAEVNMDREIQRASEKETDDSKSKANSKAIVVAPPAIEESGDSKSKANIISKLGLSTSLFSSPSKRHILHIDPELGLPQIRVELSPQRGEEIHFYQDVTRQPETVHWDRTLSTESVPFKTRSTLSMSSSGVTSRFSAAMNSTGWHSEAESRGSGIITGRTRSSNRDSILADEVVASLSQVAPVIARQMEKGSKGGHVDESASSDSELEAQVGVDEEWLP